MKQIRMIGFATVLLCISALLIAAFLVLFSNPGSSSDNKLKEAFSDKTSVAVKTTAELK